MAIQTMVLDPNAAAYTDDQIVGKINSATSQITRAGSVAAAARPLGSAEVATANLAAEVLADYIKTSPVAGQFKVAAIQRQADGKLAVSYDDVAV